MLLAALALAALSQEPVELPECQDRAGQTLAWDRFDDRPVVLLFYSGKLRFSQLGLAGFAKAIGKHEKAAKAAAVLLIAREDEGLDEGLALLADAGVEALAVLDPEHEAFQAFPVVAYPTAWVLGPDRRPIHVARGYGPQFGFQLSAACRRGAGLLTAEAFAAVLAGRGGKKLSLEESRLVRAVNLARKLVAKGRLEQALKTLAVPMAQAPPSADALELVSRLQLALGELASAETAVQAFVEHFPKDQRAPILSCRLALARGETVEAEVFLRRISPRQLERGLLQGRLHEARGELEAAAEAYRECLERQVLQSL